jgi:hypothetical protein
MLGPMKTSYLALLALSAFSPAAAQSPTPPAAGLPVATPPRVANPTQLSGTVLTGAGRPLAGVNVFLKTTFDGATTEWRRCAGPTPPPLAREPGFAGHGQHYGGRV